MKNYCINVLLIAVFGSLLSCNPKSYCSRKGSDQVVKVEKTTPINDSQFFRDFQKKANNYFSEYSLTTFEELKAQLSNKECSLSLINSLKEKKSGADFYRSFKKGVFAIGNIYKMPDRTGFQISISTAFLISKDGICVSNYHLFKSYNPAKPLPYEASFVMNCDGVIFPVVEILAASKKDDLAIFRIKCDKEELFPLALGEEQAIGEEINLISHPNSRFYRYTKGIINRTYIKGGTIVPRQSISADFAKGSSGAPIMDNFGNVIGVVAGTQNIYYEPDRKGYQMTISEIIPVSRLKKMIK